MTPLRLNLSLFAMAVGAPSFARFLFAMGGIEGIGVTNVFSVPLKCLAHPSQ
jgi:hypothetical protein